MRMVKPLRKSSLRQGMIMASYVNLEMKVGNSEATLRIYIHFVV